MPSLDRVGSIKIQMDVVHILMYTRVVSKDIAITALLKLVICSLMQSII
jgi:hypothetical protein